MNHFEEFRTLYQFVTKGNYESLKASIDKFKEFDVNSLYDEVSPICNATYRRSI
jgi:hypothetical protein